MAAEPQIVWMPGGVRTEIHLTGEDTDGAFCLLVDEPSAGWSLPAHIHTDATETIHVLAGQFEMAVDGTIERLGAGDTLHVPAGITHAGGNVGAGKGCRLIVFSPAGMEGVLREVGAASRAATVDPRAALDSALRHGRRFVG